MDKIVKNTLININEVEFGDHICSIYQDKQQQFSLLVPFFKAGLENNQKCIYIADENLRDQVISEFVRHGIEVEKYLKSNQMIIITKRESYLKNGFFDPDKMIEFLKKTEEGALKDGYSGLRLTGEMSWVLANISDIEKLIRYENKLNNYFLHSKCVAICQYNENKFKPEVLLEILDCHPLAIIYGNLFENFYFSSISNIEKAAKMPSEVYGDLIKQFNK